MPKTKFIIKHEADYACDFHYGSMALNSHLPEYKTCSILNQILNIKLHKIPDLKLWHPTETTIQFPFYLFEEAVSKYSCYLISNNGFEINNEENSSDFALFDNIPKTYKLFGKKNSSIFPVKDLNIDFYLIVKHPRDDKRIFNFVDALNSQSLIQAVGVDSSEYLKHHNDLLVDIELSLSEYKSLTNSEIRRRKQMLKKTQNKQTIETPQFQKKFYNI